MHVFTFRVKYTPCAMLCAMPWTSHRRVKRVVNYTKDTTFGAPLQHEHAFVVFPPSAPGELPFVPEELPAVLLVLLVLVLLELELDLEPRLVPVVLPYAAHAACCPCSSVASA